MKCALCNYVRLELIYLYGFIRRWDNLQKRVHSNKIYVINCFEVVAWWKRVTHFVLFYSVRWEIGFKVWPGGIVFIIICDDLQCLQKCFFRSLSLYSWKNIKSVAIAAVYTLRKSDNGFLTMKSNNKSLLLSLVYNLHQEFKIGK